MNERYPYHVSFVIATYNRRDVTADTLRHSYIAHLVRIGARLTELERICGALSAAQLRRYASLAPSGPAKPISEIDLVYPVLH